MNYSKLPALAWKISAATARLTPMVCKGHSHSPRPLGYRTPLRCQFTITNIYLLGWKNLTFLHDSKSPSWTHPSYELSSVAVWCQAHLPCAECILRDFPGSFPQCPCCLWAPEACPWTSPLPVVYRLQIQNFCLRWGKARNPGQKGWEGNILVDSHNLQARVPEWMRSRLWELEREPREFWSSEMCKGLSSPGMTNKPPLMSQLWLKHCLETVLRTLKLFLDPEGKS